MPRDGDHGREEQGPASVAGAPRDGQGGGREAAGGPRIPPRHPVAEQPSAQLLAGHHSVDQGLGQGAHLAPEDGHEARVAAPSGGVARPPHGGPRVAAVLALQGAPPRGGAAPELAAAAHARPPAERPDPPSRAEVHGLGHVRHEVASVGADGAGPPPDAHGRCGRHGRPARTLHVLAAGVAAGPVGEGEELVHGQEAAREVQGRQPRRQCGGERIGDRPVAEREGLQGGPPVAAGLGVQREGLT